MKKHFIASAVLCAALLTTGCGGGESSSVPTELTVSRTESESGYKAFPVTVCGEELESSAERAVSLSPAVTEIIAELGFSDRIVGISSYCDYPSNLSAPAVGSAENPDIKRIKELEPDVVFTLTALSEREDYELTSAGIKVVRLSPPESMEGFSALYRDIASAFYGKELTDSEKQTERAAELGSLARTLIENSAAAVKLESFVYVTGKCTLAGADTFENAVLSLCGENLCAESGYSAPTEGLAPKYIVADNTLDSAALMADENISAMINGGAEVVYVTSRCFERPSSRTSEVFAEISGQLSEKSAENTEE